MSNIRLLFEQNQPIFHFAYGLSFFVMGLAIALQSRSSSRLELARSLAWLAAFGITHSLYEWGELFSPVQEAYLTREGIEALHGLHLIALSVSLAFLFEFGVALLRPLGRGQWLHWVTVVWFAAYLVFILVLLPRVLPDPLEWHRTADALARYTIGFPAGMLAAYGLREQTFRHVAPLDVPHIVSMLRAAGISLALYAFFGGLIPPPVPFFPGNVLNSITFEQFVGIPPLVFLTLIGLILAVTVIRALEVFRVEMERRIEAVEQQQILASERERIARELHDSTIQTAYTAGLLIDSARKLADPESQIASRLEKAVQVQNEVIRDLRRNLGELRVPPSSESLSAALKRIASDPRFRSLVEISLQMDFPGEEQISPRETEHILAIVNEALSNVVRHAKARHVRIAAQQIDNHLKVAIQDDGMGIDSPPRDGFGLRNMQERARLLNGQLSVSGKSGKGTTVLLDIPTNGG
jgi:signal transduction histidine kinase